MENEDKTLQRLASTFCWGCLFFCHFCFLLFFFFLKTDHSVPAASSQVDVSYIGWGAGLVLVIKCFAARATLFLLLLFLLLPATLPQVIHQHSLNLLLARL